MVQKLYYLFFIFKLILFQSYNPSVFKTCQTHKCQDMLRMFLGCNLWQWVCSSQKIIMHGAGEGILSEARKAPLNSTAVILKLLSQ